MSPKFNDMKQVRPFAVVSSSSENEMSWDARVLCIVISQAFKWLDALPPALQRKNAYQNVEYRLCFHALNGR